MCRVVAAYSINVAPACSNPSPVPPVGRRWRRSLARPRAGGAAVLSCPRRCARRRPLNRQLPFFPKSGSRDDATTLPYGTGRDIGTTVPDRLVVCLELLKRPPRRRDRSLGGWT